MRHDASEHKQRLICINYGECSKAGAGPGHEEIEELNDDADPLCSECHGLLIAPKVRGGGPRLPPVWFLVGLFSAFIVITLIALGTWYAFTPPSPDKQMEKMLVEAFPWLKS